VAVTRPERVLQPERSALDRLGYELRRLRKARGYSLARVAGIVYVSSDLIQKIETAERRPGRDLAERLDEALRADGALLGLWEEWRRSEESDRMTTAKSEHYASQPSAGLVAKCAFTLDDEERIINAARRLAVADASIVDPLARMLAAQRETEDFIGSAPFVKPVIAQLAVIESLVTNARGAARPKIVDVAAQWAEFAGWLHTSTGRLGEARAWFDRTSELAIEAGNVTLVAKSLSWKGHLAFLLGEIGPMLGLAQAARRDSSVWVGQRAYDAYQEARGLALIGDSEEAIRKVDEGTELALIADERSDAKPAFSYYYSLPFFAVERGLVYRYLRVWRKVV